MRRDVLLDFADTVNALDGSYITAEDVGTSARDMVMVAQGTRFVTGLPAVHGGSGDPSPFTALGVEAAIRACAAERFGSRDLDGCRIAVVGCGRVGEQLARRLAAAGAQLLLSDIDEGKRRLAAELPGAEWAAPETALLAELDVLAPCALGSAITDQVTDGLRCAIVCGSANNQLADDRLADRLAARGVLYAPDFIVNAGGLINVGMELEPRGYDAARARDRVTGIEDVTARILAAARTQGITPLRAAVELARKSLDTSGKRFKLSPTAPPAETPPRPDSDRTEIPQPARRGDRPDGDPAGTPRIAARGIRGGRA
jgi:leucine dehydrogenase